MHTKTYDMIFTRMENGSAARNRFDGYNYIYFTNTFLKFFGYGNGGEYLGIYYAGLAKLYVCYGIIGTCILGISLLIFCLKINTSKKILLLVFIILNTGTELLFQPIFLVFIAFVIYNDRDNVLSDNEPYYVADIQTNRD